jgi:hypothetical protein
MLKAGRGGGGGYVDLRYLVASEMVQNIYITSDILVFQNPSVAQTANT